MPDLRRLSITKKSAQFLMTLHVLLPNELNYSTCAPNNAKCLWIVKTNRPDVQTPDAAHRQGGEKGTMCNTCDS
jgi:hypothetical protein